jgi:hypothetical protein
VSLAKLKSFTTWWGQTTLDGKPNLPRAVERPIYFETEDGRMKKIELRKAIVSPDYRYFYAIVSDKYELVQHEEVYEATLQVLRDLGHEPIIATHPHLSSNGAHMFLDIYVTPFSIEGDDMYFGIRVTNSYDGSYGIHVLGAGYRLACANGMVFADVITKTSMKHFESVRERNFEEFKKAVKETVKSLDKVAEAIHLAMYEEVDDIQLVHFVETNFPQVSVRENVYAYLKKHGIDLEKQRNEYLEARAKFEEEKKVNPVVKFELPEATTSVNLWLAYNALTYVLTRIERAGVVQPHKVHELQVKASKLLAKVI